MGMCVVYGILVLPVACPVHRCCQWYRVCTRLLELGHQDLGFFLLDFLDLCEQLVIFAVFLEMFELSLCCPWVIWLSHQAFAGELIGEVLPNTHASGRLIQRHWWLPAMVSSPLRYQQGCPSNPGVTKMPSMGFDPLLCVSGRSGPCLYAIASDIPKLWKKLQMLGSWTSLLTSIAMSIWLPSSIQEVRSGWRLFQNCVCGWLFLLCCPWMPASIVG